MKPAAATPPQKFANGDIQVAAAIRNEDSALSLEVTVAAHQPLDDVLRSRPQLPRGSCLVTSRGEVCAADPQLTAWFTAAIGAIDASTNVPWRLDQVADFNSLQVQITRCLSGEAVPPQVVPTEIEGEEFPTAVSLTRLDGVLGPMVILSFAPATGEPTSSRHVDALTQLSDRRALADCAAAWRRAAGTSLPRFALLFLDVDNFKSVNDRFGHSVGDVVLRALALRWLGCIRERDLATRYGGDEFVLLIRDATTHEEVEPVLRRLAEAAQAPVAVGEVVLRLGATIGWATPTTPDWTIESLVAAADADMYERKRRVLR